MGKKRAQFCVWLISAIMVMSMILIVSKAVYAQGEQKDHEKIVEKVGVNWWLIPVMAVDKDENPVMDLKSDDIKVKMNNTKVSNFSIVKSSFSVSWQEQTGNDVEKTQPVSRKKTVVLLFDLAMSGNISTGRAKQVARTLIDTAAPDTTFIIMSIEPNAGLRYVAQGDNKENVLWDTIKKEIKGRITTRMVGADMSGFQKGGRKGGRLDAANIAAIRDANATYFRHKSEPYFQAFESLYFFLNGIDDNKFVYFFTEGISDNFRKTLKGGVALYNESLKQIGENLGRCGAVLFMINTMGVDQDTSTITTSFQTGGDVVGSDSILSGEDSLHYLARKSGGKYIEGTENQIVRRILNLQRSYYEISFPDIPGAKGLSRNISITSTRKNVSIVSLRSVEQTKTYAQLSEFEKEMLAVHLISGNPLTQRRMEVYNAISKQHKDKKGNIAYEITLPETFARKKLDLFKVQVDHSSSGAQVSSIEKENVRSGSDILSIVFKPDKKKKQTPGTVTTTHFVLVEPSSSKVRVHGLSAFQDGEEVMAELIKEEKQENSKKQKKRKAKKSISTAELKRILEGAAEYCERLKTSAFHFFCVEDIVETHKPLTSGQQSQQDISVADQAKNRNRALRRIRETLYTNVEKYEFTYRLIKQGNKINEEREWVSSHDNVKVDRDKVASPRAFFARKAVFAPVTLLDKDRQSLYDYTFLRHDSWQNRRAAVIEVVPKANTGMPLAVYGDVWIDTLDFSVLKIEAHPQSIGLYKELKKLAKKLRTRLILTLETEFGELNNGIRFPTLISSLEKYKGGRIISGHKGQIGWERTRTVFKYKHYRFFNVEMDVSVQK